jgi:hypothetical protein
MDFVSVASGDLSPASRDYGNLGDYYLLTVISMISASGGELLSPAPRNPKNPGNYLSASALFHMISMISAKGGEINRRGD